MRPLHPTLFWTRIQNSLPTPSTRVAAVLTSTPASALLARLLPPHVPILTPAEHAFQHLRNPVHALPTGALSAAAHWAVRHSVAHLLLPTTRLERALGSLTTLARAPPPTGIEHLPPGVVRLHAPLANVHEHVLDATAAALLPPPRPSFQALARSKLGDVDVTSVLRHALHKQQALDVLDRDATDILRDTILEASHWGYVVARRSTLAAVFNDPLTRLHAVEALSRIVQHVSGAPGRLPMDDEHINRMARDVLKPDPVNGLAPLPKGRTVAGVVVRPATGRFAKRLLRQAPHDLMILTREPDHESASIHATRLRGNFACAPLGEGGTYWDNRFVIMAGSVSDLSQEHPPLRMKDVLLAALTPPQGIKEALTESEFYVRQIRSSDWERITASTSRVRDFQVPFQCIRALPAVFQKEKGSNQQGVLVASPHLGISARSDMYYTAVRMPRFRTLPEGLCPGFVEEYTADQDSHAVH